MDPLLVEGEAREGTEGRLKRTLSDIFLARRLGLGLGLGVGVGVGVGLGLGNLALVAGHVGGVAAQAALRVDQRLLETGGALESE